MAVYVLPAFNLAVNIWRFGVLTTAPPSVTALGNLSPGRIVGIAPGKLSSTGSPVQGGMWLRLPAATDVRDGKAPAGADTIEVPAGSGRFYTAGWVDDIGLGFPNEHRFAELIGITPWPVPFPTFGVPPPPPPAPSAITFRGVSSSLGAQVPVQNLLFFSAGITVEGLCVAIYNPTGLGAPVIAMDGTPMGGVQASPIIGGGPIGAQCFVVWFQVAPGAHTWSVTMPLGLTGIIEMSCGFFTGGTGIPSFGAAANGIGGVPTLTPGFPTGPVADASMECTVVIFGAVPQAWVAPIANMGPPMGQVIGLAQVWFLPGAGNVPAGLITPAMTTPVGLFDVWGGARKDCS